MVLALLITLIVSLQSASGADFEIDLWPGEGRPVFESVTQELRLRELPSGSSKVILTAAVRAGERLTFDDTRYRTIKPGQFLVLTSTRISGRRLGDIRAVSRSEYSSGKFGSADLAVGAGETVEYLQYRAEGTCFVRIAGSVVDAKACPTQNKAEFKLEAEPVVELWIRIVANAKPLGWLLVTDATARVVGRQG